MSFLNVILFLSFLFPKKGVKSATIINSLCWVVNGQKTVIKSKMRVKLSCQLLSATFVRISAASLWVTVIKMYSIGLISDFYLLLCGKQ